MTLHQKQPEPMNTNPVGPAETPPRRRRPFGRRTNPATLLQAARLERRESGKEVVDGIRKLCPGHGHGPCKLDLAKLSDYETGNRRPGLEHIEAFCRYYQKSPELLGLITRREEEPPEPQADAPVTHDDQDDPPVE